MFRVCGEGSGRAGGPVCPLPGPPVGPCRAAGRLLPQVVALPPGGPGDPGGLGLVLGGARPPPLPETGVHPPPRPDPTAAPDGPQRPLGALCCRRWAGGAGPALSGGDTDLLGEQELPELQVVPLQDGGAVELGQGVLGSAAEVGWVRGPQRAGGAPVLPTARAPRSPRPGAYFIWYRLLVPRWSMSWHRPAVTMAKASRSV